MNVDRLPPLKALRVFQLAAECGSFKEASEKLYVTQAAVSQQIRLLEEYFAVPLFIRLNREVQLTPEAIRLLPFIQQAFSLIEEGSRALGEDPEPDQLKITTIASFAARWLIPRLAAFQQLHPEIKSFVSTTLERHDFSDDSQDLAIRFTRAGLSGLEERLIADDYIVPLCHPQLKQQLEQRELNLSDLPLLIDDSDDLKIVNRAFIQRFSGESNVTLKMQDAYILIDAALNGQGVAAVRFSLAYEHIRRGQLVCPLNVYWDSPFSYYLVAPSAHFNRPKVALFRDWIIDAASVIETEWQQLMAREPFSNQGVN
ncbi:LysR substrate-binding domain-containing protein [uncultured Neptuniibacter sp.]|uniref:LysR substrate-binding domain-containing protein n=1 Tax=uncultured Neptuniibacter sp. TaxID=502143 RepID=UPI002621966E|nr:LysR substrate-binding domain-containing protein [uncultured Neptuniibacter sp.]